jgi:D-alanyl-D-alanine carboxypeptidase
MRGPWGAVILAVAALFCSAAAVEARAPEGALLLIDADSGAVLQAENATHPWYPASLTKVMTAYLVFEALEDGRLKLDDKVPVSKYAALQQPVKLGLGIGKQVRVKSLLEAMLVMSANDAAVVLAEAIAGSEAVFAEMMTREARQLGMTGTIFRNASGLPDPDQVTSARDLAILARAVITNFPDHYGYFSRDHFSVSREVHPSVNGWVRAYPGAEGLKTGFTCGSGYNLIGAATREGRRLIGVVLGATSSGARNARMSQLMDGGFASLSDVELHTVKVGALPWEPVGSAPFVLSGKRCKVNATPVKYAAEDDGTLPGWGMIFGAFLSRSEAGSVLEQNVEAVKGLVGDARPVILPKIKGTPLRYTALLVGLDQRGAGQACQQLRERGVFCQAMPPGALNNPQALWR